MYSGLARLRGKIGLGAHVVGFTDHNFRNAHVLPASILVGVIGKLVPCQTASPVIETETTMIVWFSV